MMILAAPIEVGVVCPKEEKPIPKKFKWVYDNDQIMKIKVDKILSVEEIRDFGERALLYRCQSFINGLQKSYEIKFIVDRYEWQLFRI